MKLLTVTLVLCLLWVGAVVGESPVTPFDFAGYVNTMVNQPGLRGASWSILIHSLHDDTTLYQWDPDRRLIPASVAKLVTSAAAIDALGPDFRFETTLSAAGQIDGNGHVRGDLIVQAGGDPTIGPKYVDSLRSTLLGTWADSLRARGIRTIDGDLVLHTGPYRLEVSSSDWEVGDVNDRFGPSMDGFAFNSNVCHLAVLPGANLGGGARFTIDPPYAPIAIRSSVVTAPPGTEPSISFRLMPEDSVVRISGEIPVGDDGEYIWISIQDPSLFFGRALYTTLAASGIEVSGEIVVDRRPNINPAGRLLLTHRSPPLSEIIKLMNKDSDNMVSEYVLRAVGARIHGSGTQRSGLSVVYRFLREVEVNEAGIYVRDGCGLARQDLCSARGIVDLLRGMYVHPSSQSYIASMAASGVDGTIGFRMSAPQMMGKVRAKTGTINHVSNLAGYLYGDNGQAYAFAILCNNFPSGRRQSVRLTQDSILERLLAASAYTFNPTDR